MTSTDGHSIELMQFVSMSSAIGYDFTAMLTRPPAAACPPTAQLECMSSRQHGRVGDPIVMTVVCRMMPLPSCRFNREFRFTSIKSDDSIVSMSLPQSRFTYGAVSVSDSTKTPLFSKRPQSASLESPILLAGANETANRA